MYKRNQYLLYAIALMQGMVFYAPVATLYRQAAGLGIFQITLIESVSLALTIALEIPWGWAADRIGYRRTMILCCGIYFVSKLVFWQADSFGGFLLERVLLSIVCAGLSGVDSSMLYLSCEEGETHRAFSIYQNLSEAGMLAAAGIYALWIGENYRLAAALTAVSYGISAVFSLGLQEVKPRERSAREKQPMVPLLKKQLGNRKLLCLILAAALLGETNQTITVFLNQLKYASVGLSQRAISVAYILLCLVSLAGGFSAWLRARLGTKRMGNILLLGGMVSCLILAGTQRALLSVGAVLLLRCSFSLFGPLYQDLQNRAVTTENRATALSMNAVLHDGLGIFLNLVFGYAAQIHLSGAFCLGAGMCLLGWGLFRKYSK